MKFLNPSSSQQGTSLEDIILDHVPSTSTESSNISNLCRSPSSTQTDQRAICEIKTPEVLRPFKDTDCHKKTERRRKRKRHTVVLTDILRKLNGKSMLSNHKERKSSIEQARVT